MIALSDEAKGQALGVVRGEPVMLVAPADQKTIGELKAHLGDYGQGADVVDATVASRMNQAMFIEQINDIRLRDRVLILTEVDWLGSETDVVVSDVMASFCKQGGRAILLMS